ncbi:hypothetical protein Back11_20780 [Paenibacillus baekrokdamisoli]|uniref:Uncharacterized protein n=1 Tax=Paenibacillus baekrokdamisoli TaxID=1712516 RepID=A0A3G9J799_9BACL|nr:hypothetical protein [Paenibacillus baekrokdamisoli]MBB3069913.1 hypothetical protein [Paenibacillus baekrokdamisoli]BBH20733.1 hypothetical protein Back11_20780 [Paenibacillus baekrokdamisoli]
MTNNNTVNDNQNEQQTNEEEIARLIEVLDSNARHALNIMFEGDQVDGQILTHELYGPIFTYRVQLQNGDGYVCGFFMRELLEKFQNNANPALWLASFFSDLMQQEGGKLLPKPPESEDEAKVLIDGTIVPYCARTIREEFNQEQVYVDLEFHEEHGPVLEAGFTSIQDGNNVCAIPLHILISHYLLNRDPAELLIQGLYRIREEHGLE